MRKLVIGLLFLFVSLCSVFSQFDAQLSQYMFHNSAFNPAAVGEGGMILGILQHRIQWVGMPNAGQTTFFSIDTPLKIENSLHGIGIRFLNENVGLFTNQTAHLQYALKKKLGDGVLSLGTDIGFVSLGFHGDSVKAHIPPSDLGEYHQNISLDTQIPQLSVVGMSFDMDVGAFYSTPTYYAGLSYLHLNSPTVNWSNEINFKIYGSLFFTGGYSLTLPDSKYVFKPSMLFKTDFSSSQLDVTGRLEYDNKYWGGLSYRIQDAVVFLAGINISGGLAVGYSYDLPTSQIITVSSGSHEIVLMYSFEYGFEKKNSKFKSIRLL